MNFDTSQPQNINFQTQPALCFQARVPQTTGRPGPKHGSGETGFSGVCRSALPASCPYCTQLDAFSWHAPRGSFLVQPYGFAHSLYSSRK